MSKVTMPEPVAWVSHVTLKTLSIGRSVTAYPEETSWLAHGLITTTQAEAYKDACVREVQQWVSVEDRLPDPETDVLVKVYGGKFGARTHDIAGLFRDEWMSQITEDIVRGCVTHWMPLPAPPTE